MPDSVLVVGELACAAINRKVDAGVKVVVPIIADEVSMPFDIGTDFHVIAEWRAFDGHRELLEPAKETRKLSDLRLDVVGQSLGQFHVFCADGDEHGSILQFWRTRLVADLSDRHHATVRWQTLSRTTRCGNASPLRPDPPRRTKEPRLSPFGLSTESPVG